MAAASIGTTHDRALATHRFVLRVALAAGTVFGWAFIFRGLYLSTGNFTTTLLGIALLYIFSQVIAIFLIPLSGAALRYGVRRALIYGTLMAAFAFVSMSYVFAPQINAGGSAFGLIASFAIFLGMHRALYWVPYKTSQGEMAPFTLTREIIVALVPLGAGLMIERVFGGAGLLMAFAAALVAAALIPIMHIRESYESFEWRYGETFRQLFSPYNRGALNLAILDGIQGITLLLIWPLAAFVILGQSFANLGAVLTLTFIVGIALRSSVRSFLRWLQADRSTTTLATIAFSSWMFRLPAGTPFTIFLADIYYHAGVPTKRFSIDALSFDQSADGGHFVDEYTALKEMGLALGRSIALVVLAVVALFINPAVAFAVAIILAGIAAAYSVVLSRRLSERI